MVDAGAVLLMSLVMELTESGDAERVFYAQVILAMLELRQEGVRHPMVLLKRALAAAKTQGHAVGCLALALAEGEALARDGFDVDVEPYRLVANQLVEFANEFSLPLIVRLWRAFEQNVLLEQEKAALR